MKVDLDGVRHAYQLCFVRSPWAFLTRLPLDQQCGENWQQGPYQQFAGDPVHDLPAQLLTVAFDGPLYTPDAGRNRGSHSVLEINTGLVPWLRTEPYTGGRPLHIMAGASLESLVTLIDLAGGQVYVPLSWGSLPDVSSTIEYPPAPNRYQVSRLKPFKAVEAKRASIRKHAVLLSVTRIVPPPTRRPSA
jgi:hypothetical protein